MGFVRCVPALSVRNSGKLAGSYSSKAPRRLPTPKRKEGTRFYSRPGRLPRINWNVSMLVTCGDGGDNPSLEPKDPSPSHMRQLDFACDLLIYWLWNEVAHVQVCLSCVSARVAKWHVRPGNIEYTTLPQARETERHSPPLPPHGSILINLVQHTIGPIGIQFIISYKEVLLANTMGLKGMCWRLDRVTCTWFCMGGGMRPTNKTKSWLGLRCVILLGTMGRETDQSASSTRTAPARVLESPPAWGAMGLDEEAR